MSPKALTDFVVMAETIKQREIENEMQQSYLDYAMSVIVGRALPDVRDGLKPVHRRVLYTMNEIGLLHNKPFKKSANIVGNCMAKYHPHGDMAIYDSLVRMAQTFSLRYPLVKGQGNFGSIDGDRAAAMRYTEARLTKLSEELLQDIDKKTVKFIPNFDSSTEEPLVLPAKVPNLLINGSSGIAVGMATNIPPHNLSEVCSAAIAAIDNPEINSDELIQLIPGPDFPTGASILGRQGIIQAYKHGKGKVILRAKASIEANKIIVTEIPYQVNKAELIEEIADLVRDKKITDITDLRDESDKKGIRVMIELKKAADPNFVLNQLYSQSRMQTTFGMNMLALVDNKPMLLPLKAIFQHFINHRIDIVTRRTRFDLEKASDRAHILEGLLIALKDIDSVIKIIKAASSVENASNSLIETLSITKKQSTAILEMRLQKLTSLEQEKISKEHSELLKLIEELKSILASRQRILNIIKQELKEVKEKYADERRTEILDQEAEILDEDELIKPESVIVTVTHSGYIKRLPVETYKQQKRGGKGIIATTTKDEDFVEDIFAANTTNDLLFFTNKGNIYSKKVYHIPSATRQAKGSAIVNLLNLKDEKVTALIPLAEFRNDLYLTMATKNGMVKKTSLSAFTNIRRTGIKAINLVDDELINVKLTDGFEQLLLATKNGLAVKFNEKDIRPMGRTAAGVRGIKLKQGDEVIGLIKAKDQDTLLTVTENGYGKRTPISDYRLISRGGSGVINIKTTDRNGKVTDILSLTESDQVMLISKKGIAIRIAAKDISNIGRATQGVRVMKLSPDDKVMAIAKMVE